MAQFDKPPSIARILVDIKCLISAIPRFLAERRVGRSVDGAGLYPHNPPLASDTAGARPGAYPDALAQLRDEPARHAPLGSTDIREPAPDARGE